MAQLLSVSLPDALAADLELAARAAGKTKSELVRDALRTHVALERFAGLRRYGQRQAETRGVGPDDSEALVDETRRARN